MLGGTQSEPLVGRTRELEVARTMLEAAASGRPQVLVLTGEAGIGKSRLARAITADAAGRGAVTLWGAGQEDLALPYLPLTTALDPLGHDRLRPLDGARLAGHDRGPTEVWADVTDMLLDAASRTTVVLVVDDLQWTDPASQALLQHLMVVLDHAATMRPVKLLTVITVRTPLDDDRTARTLSRLQREPHAVVLEVTGLDRTEVRELLGILGPAPASATLAHRIMESTSGNPLLTQSVLRRGLDDGRLTVVSGTLVADPDDPLSVSPDELDRSVVDRLERVGQPCRDLLTIAAFLGDHHSIAEVAALGDIPLHTAEELVDEAVEADLLQDLGSRCSFSHPQVRHVLFNAPRRRARQRLHLRLADGLEARADDADAPAIAHHLARAGDLVDDERRARWSGLAARQALAVGAWTDAAIAAEQALAASPPDLPWEELVDLHLLITEAASHDFDLAAATRHGSAAVALSRDHGAVSRWGRALLHLARTLVTNEGAESTTTETTHLIQDFLRDNPQAEPALRAQLLSLLSEIWGAANRIDDALDAAMEARGLVTSDTDPVVTTGVLVAEGMARWWRLDLPEARHAFEAAMELTADDPAAKPGQYATVRLNLVNHLAGDVGRAAGAAPRVMERMADMQSWAEHSLAAAAAATTALAQGRFDDVERLGATAERSFGRSGYLWSRVVALPAVALGRALRGDGTGAREAIDALAAGPGTTARYRLGIDAVLGDVERVAKAVEARPWRPAAPVANLQTLPGIVLHAEVAVAIGDKEMALDAMVPLRAAHQRGVVLSQGWTVLLSRLVGDCLLTMDDPEEAGRWLEVAGEEARARGLAVEAARVLLSGARVAARVDAADRVDRAAAAARFLDSVGALPLAAAARRLGRLDVETAGPARRAIVFTDLIDSTLLNVQVGDAAFLELVQEHDAVVRSCLRRHAGVEFKHTGDGIAAWFTEPADAVACGIAIGQDLERVSVLHPDLPFRVRTGIAVGEPLGHAGDLFGLSVVRAARLCDLAGDREVLVSSEVLEGARPPGVHFHRRGLERLKGFPEPVEVYSAVAMDAARLGAL